MNTPSILPAAAAATVMLLLGTAPMGTLAAQPSETAASSVADVPLSDLDLSTPDGMRIARDRLHTLAEQLCAGAGVGSACVDSTAAAALRQLNALRQSHMSPRDSVTLSTHVSLSDLDLSTLEGASVARQRLEATARRLCRELAERRDLTFPPGYASCVHDSLASAWAQANVIRAMSYGRTAQRATP
jgi:UrcA family protein